MFNKKTKIVSSKTKKLENTDNYNSYIGKKVYSKSGEYVGKVKDLIFKKERLAGILVEGKCKVFIGKEYVKSESDNTIMLKIEPVTNIIGKKVFDSRGQQIGKVTKLKRKPGTNKYSKLVVKPAIYKRSVLIDKKDVDVAKKNVILKKPYDGKKKR